MHCDLPQALLRVGVSPETKKPCNGHQYNHLDATGDTPKLNGCNGKPLHKNKKKEPFAVNSSLLARRVATVAIAAAFLLAGILCKVLIVLPKHDDKNGRYANSTLNSTDTWT